MTILQKEICLQLIAGGSISGNIKYGYRLKDKKGHPIKKFSHRTFYVLHPYVRLYKGAFILNKKHIRSLSKKYWIKQIYLQQLK